MPLEKSPLFTRRDFLAHAGGVLLSASFAGRVFLPFKKSFQSIPGKIVGANASFGHLIHQKNNFPKPTRWIETDSVIVGGGISGLSAAWWFKKKNGSRFILLELEQNLGGNAQSGKNFVSGYPWGAHYIPIPPPSSRHLVSLFEDLGIIESYDSTQLPIYNELFLSHEPRERIFSQKIWQEGLIPKKSLTLKDQNQFSEFFAKMEDFQDHAGSDGRQLFSIPIDESSQDLSIRSLDQISMLTYLDQNQWDSVPLRNYINYCCRDDFGTEIHSVSAWAGIHYFASRNGYGANTEKGDVLTWPEGNGWVVNQLKKSLSHHIRTSSLVYSIRMKNSQTEVDFYDLDKKESVRILTKTVVFSAPRFIGTKIIEPLKETPPSYLSSLHYSPWIVANITTEKAFKYPSSHLTPEPPLSWDNVIDGSLGLGYVDATHQTLSRYPSRTVLTYYRPLTHQPPHLARQEALKKTHAEWVREILADLSSAHPKIRSQISHVDVWIWGHGMIQPTPGYIWGEERKKMLKPLGSLFFAHTDMSGISLFEEAFYRGVFAAKEALKYGKA